MEYKKKSCQCNFLNIAIEKALKQKALGVFFYIITFGKEREKRESVYTKTKLKSIKKFYS